MAPHAVDDRLGEVLMLDDVVGEYFAARPAGPRRDCLAVEEFWPRRLHHCLAILVVDGLSGVVAIVVLQGQLSGRLVALVGHVGLAVALYLAEERVNAPEVALLPLRVERVV